MHLTLGLVTDIHFGPDTYFHGKLRKLCHEAPTLLERVVRAMDDDVRPDLLVNLGDDIEDESREKDLEQYTRCQGILRAARAPLVNVAGNHDTINLDADDLNGVWGREGPLYYSFDHEGWHLVVLHTIEHKDRYIEVVPEQIAWLTDDLRASAPRPVIVLMHHSASEQDVEDTRWFKGVPHIALVRERAELRAAFEASGRVRAVFNGHLHRNHLDVIRGIPYVTVQSLIENVDDDAPGRPAAAYAVATLTERRVMVRVRGNDAAAYQIEAG